MAYRIGWFTTACDKVAVDLFQAVYGGINKGIIKGEISFVFSNRQDHETEESDKFFQLVQRLGIPLVCFSSQKFEPEIRHASKEDEKILKTWRLDYDREIIARIEHFKPDIIVLAGYMLIVGGEICRKFDMINLHPALPGGPTGTWQEVIWQLIERKANETGAMMHLVTEELDKGPPVAYYSFPIRGGQFDEVWKDFEEKLRIRTLPQIAQEEGEENPLFVLIRREGVKREIPLIFLTVKEFADGKIRIENGQIIAEDKSVPAGYCLNKEIEEYLNI